MKEQTISEKIVTNINKSVFFSEFTFDKNDFYPQDGKKELADNILWIDDILIVIQIKERDTEKATTLNIDNWFRNTVLKTAKKQIKNTLEYFKKYDEIPIENLKNQVVDVSKLEPENAQKIIIYKIEEQLNNENSVIKFYESKDVGNIHIFNIANYELICNYLVTPAELDEYLKFRIDFHNLYKKEHQPSEKYILSHFFNTKNINFINYSFLDIFKSYEENPIRFDIKFIIDNFQNWILFKEQYKSVDYHILISEIAKLKREELAIFKERYIKTILNAKENLSTLPYRFITTRTACGFIFMSLDKSMKNKWQKILNVYTEIYKYKHKLTKCIGVIMFKNTDYIDINWTFFKHDWNFDEELDRLVKKEVVDYEQSEIVIPKRYENKL